MKTTRYSPEDLRRFGVDLEVLLASVVDRLMYRDRRNKLHFTLRCESFVAFRLRKPSTEVVALEDHLEELCVTCWLQPTTNGLLSQPALFVHGQITRYVAWEWACKDLQVLLTQEERLATPWDLPEPAPLSRVYQDRMFLLRAESRPEPGEYDKHTRALVSWRQSLVERTRSGLEAHLAQVGDGYLVAAWEENNMPPPTPEEGQVLCAFSREAFSSLSSLETCAVVTTEVATLGQNFVCTMPQSALRVYGPRLQYCPVPGSPEVLETLLELWDPEGEGLFSELSEAFEVANRV